MAMQFVALFDLDSDEPGYLALTEGERLTKVADVDDLWVKVSNERGDEGVVPLNYVQHVEASSAAGAPASPAPEEPLPATTPPSTEQNLDNIPPPTASIRQRVDRAAEASRFAAEDLLEAFPTKLDAVAALHRGEKEYVDAIGLLANVFAREIEVRDTPVKRGLYEDPAVFPLLRMMGEVYNLNARFLAELDLAVANERGEIVSATCGDVLARYAQLFGLYTQVAVSLPAALESLAQREGGRAYLSLLLQTGMDHGRLEQYLALPRQRLDAYNHILAALVEHEKAAGGAGEEMQSLSEARAMLARVTGEADEEKERRETRDQLVAIQARFAGNVDIVDPNRYLVREGLLYKVCRDGAKPYYFFLFNDAIVYSRPSGKRLKFHGSLPLQTVTIRRVDPANLASLNPDGRDDLAALFRRAFVIQSKKKSFTVLVPEEEDLDGWLGDSNALAASMRMTLRVAMPSQAPVWTPDGGTDTCAICTGPFTTFNRRHHCRNCGSLVCGKCSSSRRVVPQLGSKRAFRVCSNCAPKLKKLKEIPKAERVEADAVAAGIVEDDEEGDEEFGGRLDGAELLTEADAGAPDSLTPLEWLQAQSGSRITARAQYIAIMIKEERKYVLQLGGLCRAFVLPLQDLAAGARTDGVKARAQGQNTGAGQGVKGSSGLRAALSRRRAENKTDALRKSDVTTMLNSIRQLHQLHRSLYAALLRGLPRRRGAPWPDNYAIGQTLASYGTLFRNYSSLASVYGGAMRALNKSMPDILEDCSRNPRLRGRALEDALRLVYKEAVDRYHRQTGLVLEYTPPEHPDHAALNEALHAIGEARDHISEAEKQRVNTDKLLAVADSFVDLPLRGSVEVAKEGRWFRKEGTLLKVCRRANKSFRFWLFNDVLMYGAQVGPGHYKLHRTIDLSSATCAPAPAPVPSLARPSLTRRPSPQRGTFPERPRRRAQGLHLRNRLGRQVLRGHCAGRGGVPGVGPSRAGADRPAGAEQPIRPARQGRRRRGAGPCVGQGRLQPPVQPLRRPILHHEAPPPLPPLWQARLRPVLQEPHRPRLPQDLQAAASVRRVQARRQRRKGPLSLLHPYGPRAPADQLRRGRRQHADAVTSGQLPAPPLIYPREPDFARVFLCGKCEPTPPVGAATCARGRAPGRIEETAPERSWRQSHSRPPTTAGQGCTRACTRACPDAGIYTCACGRSRGPQRGPQVRPLPPHAQDGPSRGRRAPRHAEGGARPQRLLRRRAGRRIPCRRDRRRGWRWRRRAECSAPVHAQR